MAWLPRINCAQRETAPGLENLQGHGMGEAEEEGAWSQTGFIRLMICPYKEEEVSPGAHEDQRDSVTLLAQAFWAAHRESKKDEN